MTEDADQEFQASSHPLSDKERQEQRIRDVASAQLRKTLDDMRIEERAAATVALAPRLSLALGELGPAMRHVARLRSGQLRPSEVVLQEIAVALERCADRLVQLGAGSKLS